jgi:glutaminyl-peptide cyclotransferase
MFRWFASIFVLIALADAAPTWAAIPVYGYKIVHVYPHDTSAYTEGLFYKDGFLYESTGEAGQSTVRKVDLKSGETVQRYNLPSRYFGEGIIDWKDHLVQLTWQAQLGFVYDLATFKLQRTFNYPGEGWALTRDATHLYMSDGSAVLRILDPETLKSTGSIMVTADDKPVEQLNELEWVKGELYANIWLTNRIARIDPATGHVVGWIDLAGLLDVNQLPDPGNDVLNGIAYDAQHDRLFVTGKRWPKLFEIKLVKRPASP